MSTSMETQYHTSLHTPFYSHPPAFPLHSDQYLATSGDLDFATNFLGGSSLSYTSPHEDYSFVLHRGASSIYRAEATTVAGGGLGASGLGFPESNGSNQEALNSLFPPEELALCTGQPWSWTQAQASALHGVVAPRPVLPGGPPEVSFLPLKHSKNSQGSSGSSFVRSPDPPLPTPASMVLLSSSRVDVQGSAYGAAVGSQTVSARGGAALGVSAVGSVAMSHGIHETNCREKKHACTMCHKRFDRPSTLRKHLLVHTGEKAFVCEICKRRFGVASNLNRHVKRCALKPVNMSSSPRMSSSGSPPSTDEMSPQSSPIAQSPEFSFARFPDVSHKRGSISSVSSTSSSRGRTSLSPLQSNLPAAGQTSSPGVNTQKRRRRAPSPSRWVPASLLNFNLTSSDLHRSVSLPLKPVRRDLPREERDSWDENAQTPYHPGNWNGILAGPGLPEHQVGMRSKDLGKSHYGGGAGAFRVSRVTAA